MLSRENVRFAPRSSKLNTRSPIYHNPKILLVVLPEFFLPRIFLGKFWRVFDRWTPKRQPKEQQTNFQLMEAIIGRLHNPLWSDWFWSSLWLVRWWYETKPHYGIGIADLVDYRINLIFRLFVGDESGFSSRRNLHVCTFAEIFASCTLSKIDIQRCRYHKL